MAKKIVSTPVADAAPVSADAAADAVPATETDVKVQTPDAVVSERFDMLNQKVNDLAAALRDIQLLLKTAQKDLVKLAKTNVKKTKKTNNTGVKKTPSGFAKPTKLSDALCDFLGVEHGTELARTEVTRRINTYIKENNLQDSKDRRIILPDANLSTVLYMVMPDVPMTFFNIQSNIKDNFIKV